MQAYIMQRLDCGQLSTDHQGELPSKCSEALAALQCLPYACNNSDEVSRHCSSTSLSLACSRLSSPQMPVSRSVGQ